MGLAREVVEEADEVWLVPGNFRNGKVTMRRRYVRYYSEGGKTKAVQVVAEFERGVWTAFNVYPVRTRSLKNATGLLLK